MDFDFSGAGSGAGAAIFVAFLSALGMNKRIDNLEEKTQKKETCTAMHTAVEKEVGLMRQDMKDGFAAIHGRLDDIYDK